MATMLRPFTTEDVDFAMEMVTAEGWAAHSSWFRQYVEHDPEGGLVAEVDGARAGMVTTVRHAETGWVGNVLVRAEQRRRGLGTHLTRAAVESLERTGLTSIWLEADPDGLGIYKRLGFVDVLTSARFRREAAASAPSPAEPSTWTDEDLDLVADFDRERFGDDRRRLLALMLDGAVSAYKLSRDGRLVGYLLVRPTLDGVQLGPWIADNVAIAEELLLLALKHHRGTLRVGLPQPNTDGCKLLHRYGFVETDPSYRMVRGEGRGQGRLGTVFGIASGAVG